MGPMTDRVYRLKCQSEKLLSISWYLFKQYGKLLTSYDEAREFFTEMYLKQVPPGSRQEGIVPGIPTRPLAGVFPGIERGNVRIIGRYDSLVADRFLPDTDYLLALRELMALCAIVAHTGPRALFEIGTYRGATIANLALNAPRGARVFTLDIQPRPLASGEVRRVFQSRSIQRLQGDSAEFDYSPYRGSVDFVFIDGAHDAPYVETDTQNALKLLSPRGVIVWHDFNLKYPAVIECLSRLSRRLPLSQIEGTAFVVYRRPEGA